MRPRPRSIPDYHWPPHLMSVCGAPRRWVLAASFHIARYAGLLMRALRREPPTVLAIRTDGIGDAVLFEPALTSLADAFPGKVLHLWAPAAICQLYAVHPCVARVVPIPRGAKAGNLSYFGSLAWRLRMGYLLGRWKFDVAAYAVHSPEPLGNWLLCSVDARHRWYVPGDTENQFDWQRQRTMRRSSRLLTPGTPGGHELLRNRQLTSDWESQTVPALPRIFLSEQARRDGMRQVERWRQIGRQHDCHQVVGIMAASATSVNAYPVASWVQVMHRLWREWRALCVLLGGPTDGHLLGELRERASVPVALLDDSENLPRTCAAIAQLDGLITVDTGLAHVAVAQDVPTVVLSNGGHPGRFFPWPAPRRCVVLTLRMPCEGCLCRCKLREPECVTRIDPDDVVSAYAGLARPHIPSRTAA